VYQAITTDVQLLIHRLDSCGMRAFSPCYCAFLFSLLLLLLLFIYYDDNWLKKQKESNELYTVNGQKYCGTLKSKQTPETKVRSLKS